MAKVLRAVTVIVNCPDPETLVMSDPKVDYLVDDAGEGEWKPLTNVAVTAALETMLAVMIAEAKEAEGI